MAANNRVNLVDIDLESGQLFRSFANYALGEGDKNSQKYGVRVFKNKEPQDLTGITVVGYFIRADDETVVLSGTTSGNIATVPLSESCFIVPGSFQLSIVLTGGGVTATVRIVDGTIIDTTKGDLVDPGGVIPDLTEYGALTESINAAAETVDGMTIEASQITGTRYKLIAALPTEE